MLPNSMRSEEMNNRDTANTRLERLSETSNEAEDELQGFTDSSRDETTLSEGSGADVENLSEKHFPERDDTSCTEVTRRYTLRDRKRKEYREYITRVQENRE